MGKKVKTSIKSEVMSIIRQRIQAEKDVCVSYIEMVAAKENNSNVQKALERVAEDIKNNRHKQKGSHGLRTGQNNSESE